MLRSVGHASTRLEKEQYLEAHSATLESLKAGAHILDLPGDVLDDVGKRLPLADLKHFGRTCRDFRQTEHFRRVNLQQKLALTSSDATLERVLDMYGADLSLLRDVIIPTSLDVQPRLWEWLRHAKNLSSLTARDMSRFQSDVTTMLLAPPLQSLRSLTLEVGPIYVSDALQTSLRGLPAHLEHLKLTTCCGTEAELPQAHQEFYTFFGDFTQHLSRLKTLVVSQYAMKEKRRFTGFSPERGSCPLPRFSPFPQTLTTLGIYFKKSCSDACIQELLETIRHSGQSIQELTLRLGDDRGFENPRAAIDLLLALPARIRALDVSGGPTYLPMTTDLPELALHRQRLTQLSALTLSSPIVRCADGVPGDYVLDLDVMSVLSGSCGYGIKDLSFAIRLEQNDLGHAQQRGWATDVIRLPDSLRRCTFTLDWSDEVSINEASDMLVSVASRMPHDLKHFCVKLQGSNRVNLKQIAEDVHGALHANACSVTVDLVQAGA